MPYPIVRVLRPLLYSTPYDFVRGFFELCFVGYTFFYIVQESRELRRARRRRQLFSVYWANKWNVLDWVVALLSLAVILLRVYVFNHMLSVKAQIEAMVTGDEYVNLQPLMFQLQQVPQPPRSLSPLPQHREKLTRAGDTSPSASRW